MPRGTHTADVVVIGGGVIGLSIADALRREHLSVTLLERGCCGREASWAARASSTQAVGTAAIHSCNCMRESVAMYEGFSADLRDRTGIDCEHVQCGSLEILQQDQQYRMARSEVKAAAALQNENGHAMLELLTPDQARQLEPAITQSLLGAKHCRIAGQIRNPRLLKSLVETCRHDGVEIVEECEAKSLVIQRERVTGVRTISGDRQAGHVILAAGCWSSLLDEQAARSVRVVPVRGQMVLLRLAQPIFHHIIERGRFYLVPRCDGHVVVGSTQEPDAGFEKNTTAGGIGGLLNTALQLVPDLAAATVVQTWAGLRPGTPDGRPYIGQVPGLQGLVAATGHFRSGLTLAPVTARIVADLVVRGRTDRDISRCQPGRTLEDRVTTSAGS